MKRIFILLIMLCTLLLPVRLYSSSVCDSVTIESVYSERYTYFFFSRILVSNSSDFDIAAVAIIFAHYGVDNKFLGNDEEVIEEELHAQSEKTITVIRPIPCATEISSVFLVGMRLASGSVIFCEPREMSKE